MKIENVDRRFISSWMEIYKSRISLEEDCSSNQVKIITFFKENILYIWFNTIVVFFFCIFLFILILEPKKKEYNIVIYKNRKIINELSRFSPCVWVVWGHKYISNDMIPSFETCRGMRPSSWEHSPWAGASLVVIFYFLIISLLFSFFSLFLFLYY